MKPSIILTFDYEIFFGKRSGTFENCIYKPVEALRKVMNKEGVKGVFFVDILYYIKLLEYPELSHDSDLMKEQIQSLIKDGHDIELHLHPHWINSYYEKGKWNFKYDKYRFEQLTLEERNVTFKRAVDSLVSIGKEVEKSYRIKGFRAGGWCIQPFETFLPYFKEYKLNYDSSVMSEIVINTENHKVNFKNFPSNTIYRFSTKIDVEDKEGEFVEYKISNYDYSFLDKLKNKVYKLIYKNNIYGDGEAMTIKEFKESFLVFLLKKISTKKINYSLDEEVIKKILLKKLNVEKKEVIVFISHPKSLSPKSIEFISKLKKLGYVIKKPNY
ncbi:polysaccharide deacetylase family protein [Fusobacterium mortiferum]|uniref:hypothetical protein n=1 Tax=Fusobacterium mortiferum TaxID=850 RepID=UPI003562AB70